jgi:hypothetical protein
MKLQKCKKKLQDEVSLCITRRRMGEHKFRAPIILTEYSDVMMTL